MYRKYIYEKKFVKNNFAGTLPIFINDSGEKIDFLERINSDFKLNDSAIFDFFLYTSFLPDNSPIKGVKILGAGMDIRGTSQYSSLKMDNLNLNREEFVLGIKKRLVDFIKKNLRERNGLMLSGGIDSAILLALLPKNTVCVTWGGWGENSTDVVYAKKTAKKFGVKDHYFVYPEKNDLNIYINYIKKIGLPMTYAASIAYIKMSRKFDELGISNFYMGQNADTLFMDYPAPQLVKKIKYLKKFIPNFLNPFRYSNKLGKFFKNNITEYEQFLAIFKSSSIYPRYVKNLNDNYWFSKKEFIKRNFPNDVNDEHKKIILIEQILTESRKSQIYQNTIPNIVGIKANCPYYSKELIKFIFRIPHKYIKEKKYSKQLLKDLAGQLGVPKEVIEKGKKGLSWGYSEFIKSQQYKISWDVFEKDNFINKYIDVKKIRIDKGNVFSVFDAIRSIWIWKELFIEKNNIKTIMNKLGNFEAQED